MKKVLISILALIGIAATAFFVWQTQNEKANAAKLEAEILKGLTAKEIGFVLKSEATGSPDSIKEIVESSEKRQIFLKGIREYLALAAQARRENFAENPNFKINFEYKKNNLLADLYKFHLSQGKDKLYVVPQKESDAVWANSENEKLFRRDMQTFREIRIAHAESKDNQKPIPKLAGNLLTEARKNWATTKILSDRAKADAEFIRQPAIPLRLKILEAGILANDYLRENAEQIKPTDEEIKQYLAAHPEYDVAKKRQKAEMILQKAKNGEDFAKLAEKYSEDRGTAEKGGLYENVGTNVLWSEVEEAALDLKKGEIAAHLIESGTGFHIVKLINKKSAKNADKNSIKYTVRHILLQKNFEEPNNRIPGIPPPFMTAEEIAKAEIAKEKRQQFIGEIVRRNPVSLPEDFTVELPKEKISN